MATVLQICYAVSEARIFRKRQNSEREAMRADGGAIDTDMKVRDKSNG